MAGECCYYLSRNIPPTYPRLTMNSNFCFLSQTCRLANFHVEKCIGQGAFSDVYIANCVLNQRRVALKKVKVRGKKSTFFSFPFSLYVWRNGKYTTLIFQLGVVFMQRRGQSAQNDTINHWCFNVATRRFFSFFSPIFFITVMKILEILDTKARQDCINEIDLLRQCNHKNVIEYLASFIEENEVSYRLDRAYVVQCRK